MLMIYLLLFACGTCVASFYCVVAERLARFHASIVHPGSQCTACEEPLSWYHKIPIISFLVLHGRCHACDTLIPKKLFWSEVFGGCLGVYFYWRVTDSWVLLSIVTLVLFLHTITDLEDRIVFCGVHYAVLPILIGLQLNAHAPLAWLPALSIGIALYLFGWITKGFGTADTEIIVWFTLLFGFSSAIYLLVIATGFCLLYYAYCWLKKHPRRPKEIPFVPFIFAAFLILL